MEIRSFIVSVLLLGAGLTASAQGGRCLPSRSDGIEPYQAGEKLGYSISYNWHAVQTDVAKGSLQLEQTQLNGETVYHGKFTAQTAAFFDVFFKIRERFESWFALSGMEPKRFERDTYEGGYYAKNHFVYDRKAGMIHASLDSKSKGPRTAEIPYGDCTYDVTTLLYFVRSLDASKLKTGTVYRISFAIDDKVQMLTVTYKGRETRQVKGIGKVSALKLGISVVAGDIFEGDDSAYIWLTDDDNRLPVFFQVPLKVGAMSGRLTSWSGLRHEFSSVQTSK
ncbi:MAG: DUF3108 domain-containing protein [Bacteroidales bacterium]|nr:DUF3108 domain-containing protein [Bacteroidales bacterium]